MKEWNYLNVDSDNLLSDLDLTTHGEKGWELVNVLEIERKKIKEESIGKYSKYDVYYRYIFKKEVN